MGDLFPLKASRASSRSLVCRSGSYEARSKSKPRSSDNSRARDIACFAARKARGALAEISRANCSARSNPVVLASDT